MESDQLSQQEQDRPSTIGARFDAIYMGVARSATLRRVQRAVYGAEYPDEVEPFSFVTRSDLRRIAHALGVGPGGRVVDLACGEGGAGLWVARATGAHVTGMDVSAVAVARAWERVAVGGLESAAQFLVGDFTATGLPSAAFDGAMSIDALWAVPDKASALREVARLLRPGARFIVTTWDFGIAPPDEPQVADHRPLLHDAGFAVEAYEESATWEHYFRALVAGYQVARNDLAAEIGAAEAEKTLAHYRRRLALFPHWQRVLIVAQRI
jgi:ubiquinone/menaquinone biosynthesis C-methylase UbiE